MFGLGVISYSVNSFKFTITTIGAGETFTLPLINGGIFNFVANWGDGSANSTVTAYNVNNTHVYPIIGTYVISLSGICTQFAFNGGGSCTRVKNILSIAGDMGFTVLNFNGCSNLTGVTSTMKNLTSLINANSMFYNCTALTTVPAGIFDGSTKISAFNSTFLGCTALITVPADIFKYNTLATDFQGTFRACTHLTSLPVDLFRYNTLATTFSNLCLSCALLTSIPVDLFRYNTLVTTFGSAFRGCSALTTVPVDTFRYNTAVTVLQYVFYNCTSLASIPVDLFRYNTLVTDFSNIFRGCTSLASIPVDLFRYNTLVTTFSLVFNGCTTLTSIPVDLFRYNTAVLILSSAFNGCTALTTIPTNLFRYNTLVTDFSSALYNCPKAQFNINIFYASGETGTRFLNKSVNFTQCLYRDTFTGVQGTAPDLWNCNFGTGTPTKTQAFGGAGNSLTSLTNYASIPAAWRT